MRPSGRRRTASPTAIGGTPRRPASPCSSHAARRVRVHPDPPGGAREGSSGPPAAPNAPPRPCFGSVSHICCVTIIPTTQGTRALPSSYKVEPLECLLQWHPVALEVREEHIIQFHCPSLQLGTLVALVLVGELNPVNVPHIIELRLVQAVVDHPTGHPTFEDAFPIAVRRRVVGTGVAGRQVLDRRLLLDRGLLWRGHVLQRFWNDSEKRLRARLPPLALAQLLVHAARVRLEPLAVHDRLLESRARQLAA
mmetsp:Transcript_20837/g.68224  ORF Transcript_20837/g.68224 Transcript_20837/m.68224 type:complete len:252 (+) Transcript_20837:198-953(+)